MAAMAASTDSLPKHQESLASAAMSVMVAVTARVEAAEDDGVEDVSDEGGMRNGTAAGAGGR